MIQVKATQKQYFYQLLVLRFFFIYLFFKSLFIILKVAMEVLKSVSFLKTELFDRKKNISVMIQ